MKKIFTLLFVGTLATAAYAQSSFQLLDPDNSNADVTNGTLDVYGVPGQDLEKIIDLKNNSTSNKTVKLRRTFVSGVSQSAGSEDTCVICWNVCLPYSFNTTQQTGNVVVNAGATASFTGPSGIGFHSSFKSGNNGGDKVIRYTWFDINNTSDSVTYTVTYHISGLNISESSLKNFNFSNPQPNPAYGTTAIRYDFPVAAKTKIRLYNAVGTTVKEFRIEDQSGKLYIHTEELTNGIYFYSLLVNDKVVGTRRLIVAN